ncbi:MAG: hypothetical protein U1F24_04170 [Alphaproteobacteria bacterium]
MKLKIATPEQLAPGREILDWAAREKADLTLTTDPYEAVDAADCVITDCWVSMGDSDREYRHNLLRPYQVDSRLMDAAGKDAIFMHFACSPSAARKSRRDHRRPPLGGSGRGGELPARPEGGPCLGADRPQQGPSRTRLRPRDPPGRRHRIASPSKAPKPAAASCGWGRWRSASFRATAIAATPRGWRARR